MLLSVDVMVPAVTLFPNVTEPVKVGDAIGAFKANAVIVGFEITLSKSAVFSTFDNPRLALALAALTAPVPPLAIATTPVTFVAVPLNVPTNEFAVTLDAVIVVALTAPEKVFAVITLPAKLPVALLSTMVFIKF